MNHNLPEFENRTLDSIKLEYSQYTNNDVEHLANFLDTWMSNQHNKRVFLKIYVDMTKDKWPPYVIARTLFTHAYEWFTSGN